MPELTDPIKELPDKQLSDAEVVAAIRQAIIAEHDAVALYTLQAEAIEDNEVKEILLDIADEERVHIGELTYVLDKLTGNESELMDEGREEVEKIGSLKRAISLIMDNYNEHTC